MKKLSFKLMMMLMGVLAMSIAFTACSDDDDDVEITKANIVGKWTIEKVVINGKEDTDTDENCATQRDYQEFMSDGTSKYVYYDDNCEMREEDPNETSTWTLNGNVLTVTEVYVDSYDNKTYTHVYIYTVQSLSSTELVVRADKELNNGKEVVVDFDDDGKKDEVYIHNKRL